VFIANKDCNRFTAGYALTSGTFILIFGRIGDILGHKRMFVFGYFFLGVWSGFAGFSAFLGRQTFFDICRAFQGMGGAIIAPNALALLGRAYVGIKKNLTFAAFSAMGPTGFVMGALFASIFSQMSWWPWTFWSYGIAAWALSFTAWLVVPKSLRHDAQFASQKQKPAMDWLGAILGPAGLVLVNVAWNNGPLFGWGQPRVYFILFIGVLLLGAFFWAEYQAPSPLLPIKALNATIGYTLILVAVGWGSFGVWIWYTYRFLMEVRGLTALEVSTEYVPAIPCGLLAALITGFMLMRMPVSFVSMLAMMAFFSGSAVAAFQPAHQIYWAQTFVSIVSIECTDFCGTWANI
jgi:MFS family permease